MRNSIFIFQLLLFFVFSQNIFGQNILVGKIQDGNTENNLPFVNIIVNNGEFSAISDLEGNFEIKITSQIRRVSFKKRGYYPVDYKITFTKDRKPLRNFLNIKLYQFKNDSITTEAKEKHHLDSLQTIALIDSILKYQSKNDFETQQSYSYHKYQKSYISLDHFDKVDSYQDFLRKVWTDSTQKKRVRKKALKTHKNLFYFLNYYLFLEETASKNYYMKPNYRQEKVEAYRLSGFQKPHFLSMFLPQRPINFYKDKIQVYQSDFINPFSELGKHSYQFSINDTLFVKDNNWILVEFTPKIAKNTSLLQGFAYLGQHDFALRSIHIDIVGQKQKAGVKIQQHYHTIAGKFVPVLLKTKIIFPRKIIDIPLVLHQQMEFLNYELNPELNKQGFKRYIFELNQNETTQQEATWLLHRSKIDSLSKQTYTHLDTTGQNYKFDRYATISNLLVKKYYPVFDKGDVDISQTSLNRHEGLRLGVGLASSPRWSDRYSGKVYMAYGFKDEAFKYGLSVQAQIWEKYQTKLAFSLRKDVQEPAHTNFYNAYYLKSNQFFRDVLTYRMDRIENTALFFESEPYYNLELRLGIARNFRSPQYNYTYVQNLGLETEKSYQSFTTSEIIIEAKYQLQGNSYQVRQREYKIDKTSPYISLQYKRGLSGFLGGNFEYHQFMMEVNYTKDWLQYGKTNLSLQTGFINNDLPYSLLFNGRGSFAVAYPLSITQHFEVMPLYQFLNNRFLNIFIQHDLDKLLYFPRKQWFQPRFSIVQNVGFGALSGERTAHQNIIFEDMKKGYFETGILAHDLLRISCFKIVNLNIGTGFFVRYGGYNSSHAVENFAVKLRANFSL